jgi:hypothetical protein
MKKIGIVGFKNSGECSEIELVKQFVLKFSKNSLIFVFAKSRFLESIKKVINTENISLKEMPFSKFRFLNEIYRFYAFCKGTYFSDVLIILDASQMFIYPIVRLFSKTKLIVNFDHLFLNSYKKKNRLEKFYYNLKERLVVKFSHNIFCGSDLVQDYVASKYGIVIRVIENGGDHIESIDTSVTDTEKYSFLSSRYALISCSSFKNSSITNVLDVLSNCKTLNFVVFGNWNRYKFLKNIKSEFHKFDNIMFVDSDISSYNKNLIFSHAFFYININNTIKTKNLIEAMSHGLPIVSYENQTNRNITEDKAIYFHNEESLSLIIESISIEKFKKKSRAMKKIASRRFKWRELITEYDCLIKDTLEVDSEILYLKKGYIHTNNKLLLDFNAGHLKYQYLFYENK